MAHHQPTCDLSFSELQIMMNWASTLINVIYISPCVSFFDVLSSRGLKGSNFKNQHRDGKDTTHGMVRNNMN